MSKKEARARIKINHLLEEAGWRLVETAEGAANVDLETKTELGDDFEHTKNGFVDYLLLDEQKKPIAVLEAKRESIPPLTAKEQAREYADSLHARFVILSNGNTHYFWDMRFGNPEPISAFPTLGSLQGDLDWKPDIQTLVDEPIPNEYIALSQEPDLLSNPDYKDENTRADYIEKHKLKILRKYQVDAIKAIQTSAKDGNKRFLLEMATGTGKTLTCSAIIKLFLKTQNAKRVLFIVDRNELESQAETDFNDTIGKSYSVRVLKKSKDNWNTADIVVSTVQTLGNCYKDFSPIDFDLIISDEAHRSISGINARAVFEYFKGFKIGLTATPKDYLKNTNNDDPNSIREFERRELRDTYRTFGCESGQPTFRYGLNEGVNDPDGPYLVNPVVIYVKTGVTTQLLSDEGYAVHTTVEDQEVEETFGIKDFEKKFFNEKTNTVLCNAFLERAAKDPISGEIGKSIIFAVNQNHAMKIAQILNQIAMEKWPGKYQSDFAMQITSYVKNSQNYTVDFKYNQLRGHTKWLPNYDSSKTRVVVTVDMMTTGYDCSDLLNVVFMRPVYSPSAFIQMKGRGTRLHTFKYTDYNNEEAVVINKTSFNLVDFFGVCEYFNEKYDYTAPLELPKETSSAIMTLPQSPVIGAVLPVDANVDDAIASISETSVGGEGMRIDREMFKDWQTTVKSNKEFVDLYDTDVNLAADYFKHNILEKPRFLMTLEKIRKLFKIDRKISIKEAMNLVMNDIRPKNRDEKIQEYFSEFIADKDLSDVLVGNLYNDAYELFDAYITNPEVRMAIDTKEYSMLVGSGAMSLDVIGHTQANKVFEPIIQYINDYIPIDQLQPKN